MDRPASFPSALARLETVLDRLETLAAAVPAAAPNHGEAGAERIAALEAERDERQQGIEPFERPVGGRKGA